MLRLLVIITLAMTVATATALAQGEFLQPGENGVGIAVARTFGDFANGNNGTIGLGINGRLDINVSYGRNNDPELSTISPSVTYYFKDFRQTTMLGLGLTAGYSHTENSRGRTIDGGECLVGGFTAFAALREQNKIAVQLLASGAYFYSTQDLDDRTNVGVSLELRWLFAPGAGFRPFLGAGYVYSEASNTRAGLAMFGFVIAWD